MGVSLSCRAAAGRSRAPGWGASPWGRLRGQPSPSEEPTFCPVEEGGCWGRGRSGTGYAVRGKGSFPECGPPKQG